MCGRFTLITPMNELVQRFRVEAPSKEWKARYNAAPTQELLIIPQDYPEKIVAARWGLVPHWAKDTSIGYKMINAKAETLAEKPSYKPLLGQKRCLVLADGFYEWKHVGKTKTPFRITKPDGKAFAFAGLYDDWKHDGETLRSFTIITTEPNPIMKPIHDRMPAILPAEKEQEWLTGESASALKLLKPFAGKLALQQVSEKVNIPANDDPSVLKGPQLLR